MRKAKKYKDSIIVLSLILIIFTMSFQNVIVFPFTNYNDKLGTTIITTEAESYNSFIQQVFTNFYVKSNSFIPRVSRVSEEHIGQEQLVLGSHFYNMGQVAFVGLVFFLLFPVVLIRPSLLMQKILNIHRRDGKKKSYSF